MAAATVRPATAADAGAIARVYVHTWRAAYRELLPAPVLRGMGELRQTLAWWTTLCGPPAGAAHFVVEDPAAGVVAFVSGGAERGRGRRARAEVYTLYVLPKHQGRRLGTWLVSAACDRLLQQGYESLVIWVLDGNPARGFYESLGGARAAARTVRLSGGSAREVSYEWRDLHRIAAAARSALPS